MAIPVSIIALEFAFSTSSRLVALHCSKLHPKTIEALICAQNWLWASETEEGKSINIYVLLYVYTSCLYFLTIY